MDCSASQGDHEPVWTTTNLIVGGETGIVPSVGLGYRAERLSAYKARLTFDILLPEYEGVYTCRSELSGEFVEIFVTTSKYDYSSGRNLFTFTYSMYTLSNGWSRLPILNLSLNTHVICRQSLRGSSI